MASVQAVAQIHKELSESWLRFPEKPPRRPTRLFHYTSQEGLLGIITTNVLRATNALYLNDSSELSYGLSVAGQCLHNVAAQGSVVKEFLERGQHFLDLPTLLPDHRFYVCCFCEKPDLLSQWRAYADQGGGYALGFDIHDLGGIAVTPHMSFFPMDYGSGGNSELLAHDIRDLCNALDRSSKQSPENDEELVSAACEMLKIALIFRIFWLKHPGFREESEWRLVVNVESEDLFPVRFRPGRTTLVPYIELNLSDVNGTGKNLPIREAVHGPSANAELASRSLASLFRNYNVELPKIWGSTIPVRTLR